MDFNTWGIFWSSSFGILASLIILGNVLILLIFFTRRLRKRAQFLLISLAVADLLVGLLSVPLYIAVNTTLPIPALLPNIFDSADIFTGFTSIFTLAVVSLERMHAIGWPFRHRNVGVCVYMFAILTPWILGAAATFCFSAMATSRFIYVVIVSLTTPLLVICAAYCIIWRKQRSPMVNQNNAEREARLAKTLFLVTGASLLTWVPFQILFLLYNFQVIKDGANLPATIHMIKFLQFSNSLVNVIIYTLRIPEFKSALLRMFLCRRVNAVAPSRETGSATTDSHP